MKRLQYLCNTLFSIVIVRVRRITFGVRHQFAFQYGARTHVHQLDSGFRDHRRCRITTVSIPTTTPAIPTILMIHFHLQLL